jgi:hypothetical protein
MVFVLWSLDQNIAYAEENWVEVEQTPIVIEQKGEKKIIRFLDYVDRRQAWNFRFSVFGSSSDIDGYTRSTTLLNQSLGGSGFEVLFGISYNLNVFSMGLDFGVLTASYDKDVNLLQPKANLHIMADALFKNPYFVPYFKLGGSKMEFSNAKSSDVSDVKTDLSIYYAVGGMMSLDWFQKTLAMDAYFGYGLDTTYLVLEYENFSSIATEITGLTDIKQSNIKVGLQLVF